MEEQQSENLKDFKDVFFYALIADDNVIINELLVQHGVGFVSEINGQSPLEVCAGRGSWKSFDFLVDKIKVITPNPSNGKNLLHIAIENRRWPEKWCEKVGGVLFNEPDFEGDTPLHYAVRYKDVAATQWLIAHGANINARNAIWQKALDVAKESEFTNKVAISQFFSLLFAFL